MDGARETWFGTWLIPFVLLSVRGRDLSGHELLEKLSELGFGETRPGKAYRALRLLEGEGLIFSCRGRMECLISQRRYGLTENGEAYLEFLAHSLERYRKEIDLFFLAYEEQPAREVYR